MNTDKGVENGMTGWVKKQIALNARVLKYGVVGFVGIAANLGTMALLLAVTSERGWVPSAIANVVSTFGNFYLHNVWTFSDRQHQGSRLVRGFLFFAAMSAAGISITTVLYVVFTRFAARLAVVHAHPGKTGVLLGCQFLAILVGAGVSYLLNREFTWPQTEENAPAEASGESTQAQGI